MSLTSSPPSLSSIAQSVASCLAGHDPDALPVPVVQAALQPLARPVTTVEQLPLRSALGRVLAADIHSSIDVPAHDNAAMDGYALRGSDLQPGAETVLAVVGTALAGAPCAAAAQAGQAVRIMTGAMLPAGLDTVVPQELVRREGETLRIPADAVRPGDHRRRAGEDLARGEIALAAGRRLRPADLGLLASLGRAEVAVRRRLRVAFFSTGSELRSVGEALDPGCVYDSNRYTMHGMLQRLGVELLDLGVVPDRPEALDAAFRDAAAAADVVISSGGVGVGEADGTKQAMARLGEVLFWHLAMRPGRPLAVGRLPRRAGAPIDEDAALLFGLPGNPVAVMVTFYAFVRDTLLAMAGETPSPLPRLTAVTTSPLRKRPGRTEFLRGIVAPREGGGWQVTLTGAQGSGMLRSMSLANGLVVLEAARGDVAAGDTVEVLPFEGLL